MKITRVEALSVAPPTEQFTWSEDLPDQYATHTIVRIETDRGVEGIGGVWNATSYDFERYTAEAIRHLAPVLIGRDPLQREELRYALRPRVFPLPPQSLAAIDIALWDLAGKVAELPLYVLLGGARTRIPAYASTPLFEDVDAYLESATAFIAEGYRAIKFHTWCIPEQDLALARAVRKRFPSGEIAFMLDAENNYQRDDALRVARELEAMGFTWFEAPLHDSDLDGYRYLTERVSIPILPSGNWFQDLPSFSHAVQSKAWGRSRTDVAAMGGLSPALRAVHLSESAGLKCEIMSWGYTLVAAANLHLMLATNSCTYFEQSMPTTAYNYGVHNPLVAHADGYVYPPDQPGLGISVDWNAMREATIHRVVSET
ncbi:MAG: mandelate racemase/muconate lactonizing enzyme family protein [Pseudomonadota bacterium]